MFRLQKAAAGGALALVLSFSPASPASQTSYTTLYIPSPLENGGHSPRAAALGSAFTAVEGDLSCLYYNPAGLSTLGTPALSLSHQAWIADITQENIEAALPLKGVGSLALGANYLGLGSLQGYDATGSPTQPFQPSRFSLTLGWGGQVFQAIALGFSARGFYQSLAPGADHFASSVCAGFLWKAFPGLLAGGFYSFLESDASAELGQLKWGASYEVRLWGAEPTLFSADLAMPPQGVYQVECGAEQYFFRALALRLGSQWEWKDNQISGFRGFTFGTGFHWDNLDLDVALAPDGDLGSSHMAGLTWWFPSGPKKPPTKVPSAPPAVDFAPPSQVTANDRVMRVEMQFRLPGQQGGNPASPTVPPPELQREIQALAGKVQENPKDAKAWQSLGNLYWDSGQPGFTVQCFEEALQLQPDNQPLRNWLEQYRRLHPAPSKSGE